MIFHEFFKIERAMVKWEQFDGTMGENRKRYVIRRGNSVGIIPVCDGGESIILIKQFRYAAARGDLDGFLWEVPAGMVDADEEPMETAKRELLEEIGVEGEDFTPLISFFLSPGALDERFYLFQTNVPDSVNISPVGGNPYEHENLKIQKFRKYEIFEMIKKCRIVDAKTIASLLYFFCWQDWEQDHSEASRP
jgi:ADP-ribose pyrophosphatase